MAPVPYLKACNSDLVAGILKTENFMNDSELVLSERLVNSSVVFVGRKVEIFINDEEEKTVAIINGFQVELNPFDALKAPIYKGCSCFS